MTDVVIMGDGRIYRAETVKGSIIVKPAKDALMGVATVDESGALRLRKFDSQDAEYSDSDIPKEAKAE